MATSVEEVADRLQGVFLGTPERLARSSGFVQRSSKVTGPAFVQGLTFGWLNNPHATLEELAQSMGNVGVNVSPQGLDKRFTPQAARLLLGVLEDAVNRVVTSNPVAVPIFRRFAGGVALLDATWVTLPDALADIWRGCATHLPNGGRAVIKLQVQINLLTGQLTGPMLEPGRASDHRSKLQHAPLAPGTLRLADLGYFCLRRFAELSRQGVYWLSRLEYGVKLYDAAGTEWSVADFLRQRQATELDVLIAVGRKDPLPCRLLAKRVPPEVAAKRRKRLREKAVRKGRRVSQERWELAAWTVYITNVPIEKLSLKEALVLGRCRWQIELLFKLWKNEGHIDESRSAKPWRILCEVYAKLLGMVVQHWLLLVSCWSHADRSLVKASRAVRASALLLAKRLQLGYLVCATLESLQVWLAVGSRINKRRKDPPTFQLLSRLSKAG